MNALYDTIGRGYASRRGADPRIAAQIWAALGDAQTVINVGAGSGNHEPIDRDVIAVEPSNVMIAQRPPDSAPVVRATAEHLPFADNSFDAAMASLTLHHWQDQAKGLAELRRVARGPVVVFTYEAGVGDFWLMDYFPAIIGTDKAQFLPLSSYSDHLGPCRISPVPIPYDCTDGFLAAYWRRPAAYLEGDVIQASSVFHGLRGLKDGQRRLAADIKSGAWAARYGDIMRKNSLDLGYRLVVADAP